MPVPPPGAPVRYPRPVTFSAATPRAPDGSLQETPERARSRSHFQRGVTLLGQGAFDEAEDAFREAIALCAEEHVYLIGLSRALYYNPGYAAAGKVPLLRTIVDRAAGLAPEDPRVLTLVDWVKAAERLLHMA
jgi:cytochrome c-type biogenesis protein CcmH/NrfG